MTDLHDKEKGKKIDEKEYIANLERALIFLCECYVSAKDMMASCRENDDGSGNNKYADLWFSFPLIQGSQNTFSIDKIAQLRTINHNREANTMTMEEIFQRMHKNRKTKRELSDEIRKVVEKNL